MNEPGISEGVVDSGSERRMSLSARRFRDRIEEQMPQLRAVLLAGHVLGFPQQWRIGQVAINEQIAHALEMTLPRNTWVAQWKPQIPLPVTVGVGEVLGW
jgi:hypothetical protein